MEEEQKPWWNNPFKYFLHGIAFSFLFFILAIVWALILVILVITGALIGLIIGIIVLFFIIGGLNSFLTSLIWDIPIKTKWTSLLGHGFLLSIALIVMHIPAMIASLSIPSVVTTVVILIAYAFIDGFVAKNVASQWEEEDEESD